MNLQKLKENMNKPVVAIIREAFLNSLYEDEILDKSKLQREIIDQHFELCAEYYIWRKLNNDYDGLKHNYDLERRLERLENRAKKLGFFEEIWSKLSDNHGIKLPYLTQCRGNLPDKLKDYIIKWKKEHEKEYSYFWDLKFFEDGIISRKDCC